MKYPCLILDHDDTVVNSTATVHYPCFVEYMGTHYPHINYTLEEYFIKNFDPGVYTLFHDIIGMSDEDMKREQTYWFDYVQHHVPQAFGGMREILRDYKRAGGTICVVSYSFAENILRDYRENDLPTPDAVFGWELPREQRKPNPYCVERIMERFGFTPQQVLVLDDLKPGYDMAKACGAHFAAAGWANDIPEIERFMRRNCDRYFKTVAAFRAHLFEE